MIYSISISILSMVWDRHRSMCQDCNHKILKNPLRLKLNFLCLCRFISSLCLCSRLCIKIINIILKSFLKNKFFELLSAHTSKDPGAWINEKAY